MLKEAIKSIDLTALNYIDIAVLLILIISFIFATIRGFISSSLSLIGWILSIIITYELAPSIQPIVAIYIKSEPFSTTLSYVFVLILSLVILAIINTLIATAMISLQGGTLDRIFGAIFGLCRGILIVSFIFTCINMGINLIAGSNPSAEDDSNLPTDLRQAQTYKVMRIAGTLLEDIMPITLNKQMQEIADKISDRVPDDRFIANMTRKLYQYVDKEESDEIEHIAKTYSTTKDIIDLRIAMGLLTRYKAKIEEGSITHNTIEEDEILRLEEILKKKLNST